MKEYRQYIVGLYRVPASAQARRGEDQLDALRRGLTKLYGSGAPRQQPRHGARS
jgi:hypothetical protein